MNERGGERMRARGGEGSAEIGLGLGCESRGAEGTP